MRGAQIALAVVAAGAAALVLAGSAGASQLINRNASNVRLAVSRDGKALVTYQAHREVRRVLAWGAVNALAPNPSRPQAKFTLDYSGGWHTFRRDVWRGFPNACSRYDGPPLAWVVAACRASDGSYWALQSWQAPLPDLGFAPWLPEQRAWELHLSHWTGAPAKLEVWSDWVGSARYQELFGRMTYRGLPVYGYRSTGYGAPLDGYGRLVYLDTYDSGYGRGWRRENSFLLHRPTGIFCYAFYTFDPHVGGYPIPPGLPSGARRGPG